MAWTFTFFDGADHYTGQCYGQVVSQTTATPSGSSAAVTVPAAAAIVRIKADSAGTVANNGLAASATNGLTLAADEVVDMICRKGLTLI